MKHIVSILRVRQWVKNMFLFFPLLFSEHVFDGYFWMQTFLAFAGFCILSSGMYIFNDYLDRDRDRLHPQKRHRAEALSYFNDRVICIVMMGLIVCGLGISWMVDTYVYWAALGFVVLHVVYNVYAKHIIILDVIFIAAGFLIRIWVGGLAAEVEPSIWLRLCVFFLALFLALNKRRYELVHLSDKAAQHRQVLSKYTVGMLDQMIMMVCTLALVIYGLYSFSDEIVIRANGYGMVYSLGFVVYGFFRYMYLVHAKQLGDDPSEVILRDVCLQINIIVWAAYSFWTLNM